MCDGNWIALMPPNAHNLLSTGYQIHMKFPVDEEAIACISAILKKYRLAMLNKKGEESIIIYRPAKNSG